MLSEHYGTTQDFVAGDGPMLADALCAAPLGLCFSTYPLPMPSGMGSIIPRLWRLAGFNYAEAPDDLSYLHRISGSAEPNAVALQL